MRVLWLSAVVVALDQVTKALVLQFMAPWNGVSQSIPLIGDWLRLTFTENPGMAFGLQIGPPGTVTILSIVATCVVGWYIYQVREYYAPYLWSLSLILGGAVGNIIDRVFYGVILDYGTYFTGHVVDFIHVSLWKGFIPSSIPLLGGSYMELFPIWNVADMSIVVGVVGVLFFHQTYHDQRMEEDLSDTANQSEETGPGGSQWATSETDGLDPSSVSENNSADTTRGAEEEELSSSVDEAKEG